MDNKQFQDLLNKMILLKLPAINMALVGAIRSGNLDPMANVTSGSETLGSVWLGLCTAKAVASYRLQNFTGLSTLHINSLAIISVRKDPRSPSLYGDVRLEATFGSNLGIHVGGDFEAGCGIFSESVGIGGSVSMSGVSIKANGDFYATIGNQLCLTGIGVKITELNYGDIKVHIDGLGFFNSFLRPLENFILGQVKGPIISMIQGAVNPAINDALKDQFPQCTALG